MGSAVRPRLTSTPGPTTTSNCVACYPVSGNPPLNGFSTITSSTFYIPGSVTTSNTVTTKLLDFGTARIRGGWAYGDFLPYVTVGLSVVASYSIFSLPSAEKE